MVLSTPATVTVFALLAATAVQICHPVQALLPQAAPRAGYRRATARTRMSAVSGMDPSGGCGGATKEGAVIVGGGPSGMATALMLAKRGWTDISVIEKSRSADYYDPNVAFVYNIDRRGQFFTDAHGLTQKLAAVSVDTSEFTIMRVPPEGERKEMSLSMIDNSRPLSYWLPRSVFQQLLYDEVASKYSKQVRVYYSSTCESIERIPGVTGGIEVKVSLEGGGGGEGKITFRPRLVVGADGLKSTVRQTLRQWEDIDSGEKRIKQGKGRFDMRKQPSHSSGLRYKILTLPPSFRLGKNDEERAKSQKAYAIVSKYQDSKRAVRVGVLPWGPPGGDREDAPRGGNFITRPKHALWDVKTLAEMKEYLTEAFPQISLTDQIGSEELERFAHSSGGRFPTPQYCPGLQWVVGAPSPSDKSVNSMAGQGSVGAGVVLLGDAIHSFPPDLGQGVNSALEDVQVLERALNSCGDRVEEALPQYEKLRQADSKALIRLCQIGAPWQYRQPGFLGPKLWTANFVLRTMVLNKLLPNVFGQQVFMLIQNGTTMRYSEMLDSANRTTRRIVLTAASITLAVIFRRRLACVIAAAATPVLDVLLQKNRP